MSFVNRLVINVPDQILSLGVMCLIAKGAIAFWHEPPTLTQAMFLVVFGAFFGFTRSLESKKQ